MPKTVQGQVTSTPALHLKLRACRDYYNLQFLLVGDFNMPPLAMVESCLLDGLGATRVAGPRRIPTCNGQLYDCCYALSTLVPIINAVETSLDSPWGTHTPWLRGRK